MKKHLYILVILTLILSTPLAAQNCFKRAKLDKKGRTLNGLGGVQYLSIMHTGNFGLVYHSLGYNIESTSWYPLTQEVGAGLTFCPDISYKIVFINSSSKFFLSDIRRKDNAKGNKGFYIGLRGYLAYCPDTYPNKFIYTYGSEFGFRAIIYKKSFFEFMFGLGGTNSREFACYDTENTFLGTSPYISLRFGLFTCK